ncbi:MAG: lipase [Planctomycetota bacterium]|nr:MAG: lipase [Planctomycetota bacterium]
MSVADKSLYLRAIVEVLKTHWPKNRTVNVVCHGHSVPSGYFATPMVDSFNAYPHLLHVGLKNRYPFAVLNSIVTAIGGESSAAGSKRFEKEVLCHRPDVLTIDYGLNDRGLGLEKAYGYWSDMIKMGLEAEVKIILLTPTIDMTQAKEYHGEDKSELLEHAKQIIDLANEFEIGLVDSFAACHDAVSKSDISDVLSWSNHPNRTGHDLVVKELMHWFPVK